ncbi:MAG: NAD(P)/FAD-dependent oxidoreductase [Cyclobacteriaceae bacterium]
MSNKQGNNENLMRIPATEKPRIVVIGGGFGGIKFIKKIDTKKFQIVLLDRNNYHTFQPLLYQVATAGLEPDSIAGPLRKILSKKKDFYFRVANVTSVDAKQNMVHSSIGSLKYDHLILANGSVTNYFGNRDFEEKSFPVKQVPHALNLRSQILQNFEKAVIKTDPEEVQSLMNYVVVGGGPTGVEISGALGELKMHVLPNDYPELNLNKMQIYLIEGTEKLLGGMSEESGVKAYQYLKRFDVNVLIGKMVKAYDGKTVTLSDGMTILAQTLVWAAGVQGNILPGVEGELSRDRRYFVDQFNKIKGHENIYAIGDMAYMPSENAPNGYPMLAPVAMQQGELLAANFKKIELNREPKPFSYVDKGTMATVGRNKAVAEIFGKFKFGGLLAWMTWMFVHLFLIVEFRNKIVIFGNWVWNYFTYDRGTRLIIRPFKRPVTKKAKAHSKEEVAAEII